MGDPWKEYVDERWVPPQRRPQQPFWQERSPHGRRLLRWDRGRALSFLVQAVFPPPTQLFVQPRMPTNIAGWTIWFTAKYQLPDPDLAAVCQVNTLAYSQPSGGSIVINNAPAGYATITAPSLATAQFPDSPVDLVFDVAGIDLSGNVWTIEEGDIRVLPTATRFQPVIAQPSPLAFAAPVAGTTIAVLSAATTPLQLRATDVLVEADASVAPTQVTLYALPAPQQRLTLAVTAGSPATNAVTIQTAFPIQNPAAPSTFQPTTLVLSSNVGINVFTWMFDGARSILVG